MVSSVTVKISLLTYFHLLLSEKGGVCLWCPPPMTLTTAGYWSSASQCSTTGLLWLQGKVNQTVYLWSAGTLQPLVL